jgi:hypothetical protein
LLKTISLKEQALLAIRQVMKILIDSPMAGTDARPTGTEARPTETVQLDSLSLAGAVTGPTRNFSKGKK